MKIQVEKKTIIQSGTILFNSSEKVDFIFEEFGLRFVFQLKKRTENLEPYIEYQHVPEGNYLLVTLYNFENGLNTGNYIPLQLASVNGGALLLKLRITGIGHDIGTDLIFHYSWYLAEKEVSHE